MSSEAAASAIQPRSRWVQIGCLTILVATYVSYAATLRFVFVYDDIPQIVRNPKIRSVHFLPGYFVEHVWSQQMGQAQNLYRPLFLAWLLVNFKSFSLQSTFWRLAVVLLHLLMIFLVYILARKLLRGNAVAALMAAALFAAHPAHVEAVAWVSGATDPLSGVLFLGSFLCYLRSRDETQRSITWIAASLLLGAGAMLVKETAVMLPAVIFCYEWLMHSRDPESGRDSRWRKTAAVLAPYTILFVVYFALRLSALHGLAHGLSDVPVWKSVLDLPWVVYFYLSRLLIPTAFSLYYDPVYGSVFYTIVPVLVLGGLFALIWWWSRSSDTRLPLFLASWFLLTLAPALAFFTAVWHYDNLHDRYLYLPSVAAAILAGNLTAIAATRLRGSRKILFWGGALAVLIALFAASYRQTFYWQDDLTLFTRGTVVAPHNLVAKLNLVSALFDAQRFDQAASVAKQALEIDPNSRIAVTDLAQAEYYRGDYSAAEAYYARALTLGPPSVDQIYYLALVKIKMGRYREAFFLLQSGISRWPNTPGYHWAMGQALAGLNQWAAATDQYEMELKLNPDNRGVKRDLANAREHLTPSGT